MSPTRAAGLTRAMHNLWRHPGVSLAFGGLGTTNVPVSICLGARTSALTSMVIRPSRGLGGRALVQKRLLAVRDYGGARGITHDYDVPVLGEGVVGLAVVPLLNGGRVWGLLYVGTREAAALTPTILTSLAAEARTLSPDASCRDALHGCTETTAVVPLGPAAERLHEIARTTRDPRTRLALLELLAPQKASGDAAVILTPRQRQVLELAELGLRNTEIGARLGLTEQTVKTYMRCLMARLDARSRQEAVYRYRSLGRE